MIRGYAALIVAVLASSLLIAGCGGGGDDGSSSEALSKAQLIKQGDAICKKVATRFGANAQKLGKEQTGGRSAIEVEEALILEAAVPAMKSGAAELTELTPPSGDESEYEAIVSALETAIEDLEEDPGQEPSGPNSPFVEFDQLGKEYGFVYCSGF